MMCDQQQGIMKKLYLIIPALVLSLQFSGYSQCEDCDTRTVAQYDLKVTVTPPAPGSSGEIATFCKLLSLTGALAGYFSTGDPDIGCISYTLINPMFPADSSNYLYKAQSQLDPPGSSGYDYCLWGNVSGSSGGYYAEVTLAVGKTQLPLKVAGASFGDDFDPAAVASQLGAQLISLYVNIMDYERDKRDGGEPYAMAPEITMKPDKFKLDFNESTGIQITVLDCDGEPLKNRQISLSAEGGTIDSEQVTTDDQGKSFVLFTAGTQPEIGMVQAEFEFTTPPENTRDCPVEPAVMQIQKPEDAWFVLGTYRTTTNSNFREEQSIPEVMSYLQTGRTYTMRDVFFAAWIRRQAIWVDSMLFVMTTNEPIDIKYRATETVGSGSNATWASSCCSSVDQSQTNSSTRSVANGDFDLYAAIGSDSYAFKLTVIDSYRLGDEYSSQDMYEPPPIGHTHTEGHSDLNGDTHLGAAVQDANRDTSYVHVETDPDVGETMTTSVNQTFRWDNSKCRLTYKSSYIHLQDQNISGIQSNSSSLTTEDVVVLMSYNGEPPSGLSKPPGKPDGMLLGNRPNPCSRDTRFVYTLASPQRVTLKVFDIYGREVAAPVQEWQQPGLHEVDFGVTGLTPGTYVCRFEAGNTVQVKKMTVVR